MVVFTNIILPACVIIGLWCYAMYHLERSKVFTGGTRAVWFMIILLVPVGGPIAYFTACRAIRRYASPTENRLKKYLPPAP